ncbi:hypothetical protein FZW96_20985 [Bacillus sp. BGMRC 2118]|nr:hypothetical protein FZW96_20985 [Bacillus sp. BGMRC 2118]
MNLNQRDLYIIKEFKDCMIALASNPLAQIKSELPGCITDDLLINFETYYKEFIKLQSLKLSEMQLFLLSEIDKVSDEMDVEPLYIYSVEDIEISNYKEILESEEWNKIRKYSNEFLESMKWGLVELNRFTQVSKDVWNKERKT